MGFLKDLESGNKAEKMIHELFSKHGYTTTNNPDRSKLADFDIEVKTERRSLTIEAKFDLYCAKSGNIAIEFYNPKQGKPSGINATKADIWAHIITSPLSIWFVSVPMLRYYVNNKKTYKLVTCGGDKNSSMYLYKKDVIFDEVFTRVDDRDKTDFERIIDQYILIASVSSDGGELC